MFKTVAKNVFSAESIFFFFDQKQLNFIKADKDHKQELTKMN